MEVLTDMDIMSKIGFGGSCHWCTEAIFQSLKGVTKVQQGWIASEGDAASFSEAVIVSFDEDVISLQTLIAIHLHTHSCTSMHNMRSKYRSAIYTFNDNQIGPAREAIEILQKEFDDTIITVVIPFIDFKLNTEDYLSYYYSNPQKPFCEIVVGPKLRLLLQNFSNHVDMNKVEVL